MLQFLNDQYRENSGKVHNWKVGDQGICETSGIVHNVKVLVEDMKFQKWL